MKILTFILLCCFAFKPLHAQWFGQPIFQNCYVGTVTTVTCPADTLQQIQGFTDWEYYQTLNNKWDGVLDSTKCFSVDMNGYLSVSQMDTSRFLFYRRKITPQQYPLFSNNYLVAYMNYPYLSGVGLIDSVLFAVQVQIPDSNGSLAVPLYRRNESLSKFTSYYPSFCFSSEKFPQQFLTHAVGGFKLKGTNTLTKFSANSLCVDSLQQFGFPGFTPYTELTASFNGTYYEFSSWNQSNLILYRDTTYPSMANWSYVPVYAGNPQNAIPQNIILTINPNTGVVWQPYTALRGAEVFGMPGVYHNLTIQNNGGDICVPPFLECFIFPGDIFNHISGNVHLGGTSACMQFQKRSTLAVADNATFDYGGSSKQGILYLRGGSTMNFGQHSTLNIHNNVVIKEQDGEEQIYLTLNPTSTLRFMPKSRLFHPGSSNKRIRLNIKMKGGILDDSGLPEDDKLLINRIYDDEDLKAQSLMIQQVNGSERDIICRFNAPTDASATVHFFNMAGQRVYSHTFTAIQGINAPLWHLPDLTAGVYFAKLTVSNQTVSTKFYLP